VKYENTNYYIYIIRRMTSTSTPANVRKNAVQEEQHACLMFLLLRSCWAAFPSGGERLCIDL
jgi:hypothetical protein